MLYAKEPFKMLLILLVNNVSKTVGHTLLAKLGKKRLRPGGKKATNWLIDKGDFNNKKY